MTHIVFVYGSLTQPEAQLKIIGRALTPQPDSLTGYTKGSLILNGGNYPVADPDPAGMIDGVVLLIDDAELIKLDEYETDAYWRKRVKLQSGLEAWVYTRA